MALVCKMIQVMEYIASYCEYIPLQFSRNTQDIYQ